MIRVKITIEDLEAAGACYEGVASFEEAYPNGLDIEWTVDEQRKLITGPCKRYIGWAVDHLLLPAFSVGAAAFNTPMSSPNKEAWLACLAIAARDEASIHQALVRGREEELAKLVQDMILGEAERTAALERARWGQVTERAKAVALVADALYAELYRRTRV